jgi:MmyB-like transcription regulator ligand binding domain
MPTIPAYVVDAAYDVLAWNRLATHFIGDLSRYEDRNMIRWTFLRAPQEVVWSDADFVRFTRSTVADLRAAYARYPGEPGIDSLVTEMLALSPRFAEMWAEHEVEVRGPMLKHVDHPWPASWSSSARCCTSPRPASASSPTAPPPARPPRPPSPNWPTAPRCRARRVPMAGAHRPDQITWPAAS